MQRRAACAASSAACRTTIMRLNGRAGFTACGPAFQRVQPAGRPAAGRNARPTIVLAHGAVWSLHRNVQRLRQSCCALGHVDGYVTAGSSGRNGHVELVEPDETWSQSLIRHGAGQLLISEEKLD